MSRSANGIVKFNNSTWKEEIFYSDPAVINIFTFRFKEGSPANCLSSPNKVILSESTARKYFGNSDPLGRYLYLYCTNCPEKEMYQVTGIFEDFPPNSHVHINVLASFSNPDVDPVWAYYYVLLEQKTNPDEIMAGFTSFSKKYLKNDFKVSLTPELQNIRDIHLKSSKERELEKNGSMAYIFWVGGLAALVFLITAFNFFNIRHIALFREYKSVQVLRYSGAGSGNINGYQLLESVLYSLLAALLAFLAVRFLYPYFNLLMNKNANAGISHYTYISMISLLILVFAFSLIGLSPYLIVKVSRFTIHGSGGLSPSNPVGIRPGNRFKLMKIILGIQYVLAFILIVSVICEISQIRLFMKERLGSNARSIICVKGIPCQITDKYSVFRQELMKSPLIEDVTTSMEEPGYEIMDMMGFDTIGVAEEVAQKNIYVNPVGDNFFTFYGIPLIEGNHFGAFVNDDTEPLNYILNEKAVKYLGWTNKEAVGKPFRLKSPYIPEKPGRIIGVVRDFQPSSVKNEIKPYVFFQRSFWLYNAQIKYDTTMQAKSIALIKSRWNEIYPDFPFEYEFVEDMYQNVYKSEFQLKNISLVLSILALLLSSIGLFGITGIVYENKIKEIGIRKVNGANKTEISYWLIKDIVQVVLISIIIAAPFSWFLMKNWLESFANKITLSMSIFLSGGIVILLMALLTVGLQTLKAASGNPVEALRYE